MSTGLATTQRPNINSTGAQSSATFHDNAGACQHSDQTNHHHHHHHHTHKHPHPQQHLNHFDHSNAMDKKNKGKKAPNADEASKLIAAKINQLELDAAGEKDQEAEIEREVRKANREFNNHVAKYDDTSKIEALSRRCTDLLGEMKRLERDNIKNKKKGDLLQKEKDHSRNELSKTNGLKEKLEKLCRELQKENNRMKAETKSLMDADKNNHEAWDIKYSDIMWQLQAEQTKKDSPPLPPPANMEMDELQRFKSFLDQYDLRELHFHSSMRMKELEVQINMAKFEKQKQKAEQELARSHALNSQVLTFSKTETELRSQLNIYVEKFKQVEDTLNNSNDLFLTFRKEMEEMSKKTKRLEKENHTLTRKHDLTNRNILEMAEERTRMNLRLEALERQKKTLTSIIAGMQEQGRRLPAGVSNINGVVAETASVEYGNGHHESAIEATDESDYNDEDYDDGSDEYDEDTEEELQANEYHHQQAQQSQQPQPFGPVPPPMLQQANGVAP